MDIARELGDDEEDRQQIDEPQRAERLDEGLEVLQPNLGPAGLGGQRRRLEAELDRHPEHVEIGEMHHLAVEIGAPVAIDHDRQEQARDQEEVRHPERLREHHDIMHESGLLGGLLDPQHRMHHHDHDDADALGIVDPIDATARARGGTICRSGCAVCGHLCPVPA
ncbi:hypothetical protein AB7M50_006625 [Bradyrhizobium elkanii]